MNSNFTKRSLLALATALSLACGGGGGAADPNDPVVSLSASPAAVPYGEPATVSWQTRNVRSATASFPLGSSEESGSFTDRPGADTTYTYVGRGNGKEVTATLTVRVAAANRRILLVSDPADPSTDPVRQFLQGLTTQAVQVSAGLPAPFVADLVVIADSGQVGTADAAAVRSHLQAGKGAVLVGRAPRRLASGGTGNTDVTAVGTWLGGATKCVSGNSYLEVVGSQPQGFPLSAEHFGDRVFGGYYVGPVASSAFRLTKPSVSGYYKAFAYSPGIGGRVGYAAAVPVGDREEDRALRGLFLSVARWAAN